MSHGLFIWDLQQHFEDSKSDETQLSDILTKLSSKALAHIYWVQWQKKTEDVIVVATELGRSLTPLFSGPTFKLLSLQSTVLTE